MALPSKCGQNVSAVSGNLQSDLPVIRCHSRCIHRSPQPASQRPTPVEHSNQCTCARSLSAASQSTPPKDCSSCQIHIEFKRENSPYANRLQPSQLAGCPIPCCVRCVGSLKDTDFSPYIHPPHFSRCKFRGESTLKSSPQDPIDNPANPRPASRKYRFPRPAFTEPLRNLRKLRIACHLLAPASSGHKGACKALLCGSV